jgi:hypothetical protein
MYELIFWQYEEEVYLNHHEVYEQLSDDETVLGLETLPIDVILNRINRVFANWEKPDASSFKNSTESGGFFIKTTPQSVKIDCYGLKGTYIDTLVSILDEFHCPLYDPQVPARYDDFFE